MPTRATAWLRKWTAQLAFPAMLTAFGLYVLFHSPVFQLPGCVFCDHLPGFDQILVSFSATWLIMASAAAGWIVAHHFSGASFEKPVVFGLSAFALIIIPAAWLGGIADPLRMSFLQPPLGPFLASIPAVIVIAIGWFRGGRPRFRQWNFIWPGKLEIFFAALSGVVLFSAAAIGLSHPATSGDALSYHANLAVYFWREGNLGSFLDQAPDTWALAHPGTVELWFGLLREIAGEGLANLGQLPFVFLGVVSIAAFGRRLGLPQGAARFSGWVFPLVPMVALQSVMQPNDVAGAVLFMAVISLACAPSSQWTRARLVLLGLGLGLLATAKLALLPYVATTAVFCAGMVLKKALPRGNWRGAVLLLLILTASFLVTVEPWWVRNLGRYGNPVYPSAIPFLGRGVVIHDLGTIDAAFVPRKWAWPLYPLIEPHDDRSGFGALWMIGVIPGLAVALTRARRQPMALFVLNLLIMLPAWWIFTLHEPRFLLGLVGLSFAFIPFALLPLSHPQRRTAGLLLAIAALFSVAVTFDQALLPFARQPNDRSQFYDRVWAVDSFATTLPEGEGIFLHTGFAPGIFEYTAFYPLLGASQTRSVIPYDGEKTTAFIVERMRSSGVKYAYIAASPEEREAVKRMYDSSYFELVHQSSVVVGEKSGARRVLYRLAEPSEEEQATTRYLFRLR